MLVHLLLGMPLLREVLMIVVPKVSSVHGHDGVLDWAIVEGLGHGWSAC